MKRAIEPRVILLAAGLGSRYRAEAPDEDKLLAASQRSDVQSPSVILSTLKAIRDAVGEPLVVVRNDNRALIEHLSAADCDPLCIASDGLGHSLAQAIAFAPDPIGWLVVLADMPYIRPQTLSTVAAAIKPNTLVAPLWQGQRGHPRGIGSHFGARLLMLDGELGAHALFSHEAVLEVPVDDPGVLQDIDLPSDRQA